MAVVVAHGNVVRGAPCTIKARVIDDDDDPLTESDLSAISLRVFNKQTATQVYPSSGAASIGVADTIHDALLVWPNDSTGYNFKDVIPAAAFDDDDTTYRAEYKLTPVTGEPSYLLVDLDTVGRLTP